MKNFWKILTFERMISPVLLQIVFWAGVCGTFYGTFVLYSLGNDVWPLPLIFGPLLIRVLVESWILAFRTYDRLVEMSGGPAVC